jgi:hypothetical protein
MLILVLKSLKPYNFHSLRAETRQLLIADQTFSTRCLYRELLIHHSFIYATMIISIINYAYQNVLITMNATTMSSNFMSQIVGMLSGLTINNTSSDYVTTVCNNY